MDQKSQPENSSEKDSESEEQIFGVASRMVQSEYIIEAEEKEEPAEPKPTITKEASVAKEEENVRATVKVETPGTEDDEEDTPSRGEAESCTIFKKPEQDIFVESDTVVNSDASACISDGKVWKPTNEEGIGSQGDTDFGEKLTGVVVKWVANRGYGFIKTEPNNRDYFFHASDILPITRTQLNLHENVTFHLVELEEGKTRAVKVRGDGTGEKVVWAASQDSPEFQPPRNKKWQEHQHNEYYKSQARGNNYFGSTKPKNRRSRGSYERGRSRRRSGQRHSSNNMLRPMYVEVTPEQMSLWKAFCSTHRELGLLTSNMVTHHPPGAMVFKNPYMQPSAAAVAVQQAGQWQTNQPSQIMPHSISSSMLPNPAYNSTVHLNTMAQLLQTLTAGQSAANANYGMDSTTTLDAMNYFRNSSYDEPYPYQGSVSGTYQELPPLHDAAPIYNQYMDSPIPEAITMHARYPEINHYRASDSVDPKSRLTGSNSSGWDSYTQTEAPINPYKN